MTQQKRKQFWVDAPLQIQMLGYVLLTVAASLLLVSFSVIRGLSQASAESRQIFHSLDWVIATIRAPLTLSSCLSILAAGLVTLIWSHRFAGPLRVLSAAMSRLKHGNFTTRPKIRDTDTLQDVIKEFAQMQDGLAHMLKDDHKKLEEAVKRLEAAAAKADGADGRELSDIAASLRGVQKKLHF